MFARTLVNKIDKVDISIKNITGRQKVLNSIFSSLLIHFLSLVSTYIMNLFHVKTHDLFFKLHLHTHADLLFASIMEFGFIMA